MTGRESELAEALMWFEADGDLIRAPQRQVDPRVWADAKKLLENNIGKWVGGKTQAFRFPFPAGALLASLQAGERPSFKGDFHYFPTPPEACSELFNCAIPPRHYGMDPVRILEPSAGQGAIVRYFFDEFYPGAEESDYLWDCVEAHPVNRRILEGMGLRVVGERLEDFAPGPVYDYVYANPPFMHALPHARIMVDCLKTDGEMACILPSSFGNKREEADFVRDISEVFEGVYFRPLEDGSFKKSGTGVSTKILVASIKQ